ncbi:MAG TPA: hypothetical protein VK618_09720, partial [Flavitalea sp.]|nr:hypothetical protein [Flavitalea sp.]
LNSDSEMVSSKYFSSKRCRSAGCISDVPREEKREVMGYHYFRQYFTRISRKGLVSRKAAKKSPRRNKY